MNDDKPKFNGNIWKVTTVVVLVTAGVAWGALGNRVKNVENDVKEMKEMYKETCGDVSKIQINIGKICTKMNIEDEEND